MKPKPSERIIQIVGELRIFKKDTNFDVLMPSAIIQYLDEQWEAQNKDKQ